MHKKSMRNLIRFYITNMIVLSFFGVGFTFLYKLASIFNMVEAFTSMLYVAFFPVTLSSLGVSLYITYKYRHKDLALKLNPSVIIILLSLILLIILLTFTWKF